MIRFSLLFCSQAAGFMLTTMFNSNCNRPDIGYSTLLCSSGLFQLLSIDSSHHGHDLCSAECNLHNQVPKIGHQRWPRPSTAAGGILHVGPWLDSIDAVYTACKVTAARRESVM